MKRLALLAITLCIAVTTMAQQNQHQQTGGQRRFSPETFKRGLEMFVGHEAELTPQEGERFFPMMHEMMDKQRDINGKIYRILNQGNEAKTEDEFEKVISQVTQLELESRKLEQSYYNKKFKTVLSWKKIFKVRSALSRFNVELLRNFTPQNNQWQNNMQPNWMRGGQGGATPNHNIQMPRFPQNMQAPQNPWMGRPSNNNGTQK